MKGIGIIYLAAYLISEVGGEVQVLVMTGEVETTGVLRLCLADDGYITGGNLSITICICKLSHTWECLLVVWTLIVLSTGKVTDVVYVVWNAWLQGPYAISAYIEVVYSIESL